MISSEELFNKIKASNSIFSATTLRKNDKKVNGEIVETAGSPIKSAYKLGVPATIKDAEYRLSPGERKKQDQANNILTVYDMIKRDKDGKRGAFRRLNLDALMEVKYNKTRYVPQYDPQADKFYFTEIKTN